jgi:hypothetical protein
MFVDALVMEIVNLWKPLKWEGAGGGLLIIRELALMRDANDVFLTWWGEFVILLRDAP